MNNLEEYDYYVTQSLEERQEIIELFLNANIRTGNITRNCRHKLEAFIRYPVLAWVGGRLLGYQKPLHGLGHLTKEEFLMKAGIKGSPMKFNRGNKLIHDFV